MDYMIIIQGALELGLIYGIMSVGIFISFRVLNIADLTVDGSFTLGAAVSAVITAWGMPYLGLFLALLAGAAAGCITGLLQTKLKIQPILAGIITMTGLYTINLIVMGLFRKDTANISLFGTDTIFTSVQAFIPKNYAKIALTALLLILVVYVLTVFLKTQLGMSIRATGDNEDMVKASSINSGLMKIIGLIAANALVSLSGAVLAQYQNFADINGGTGMVIIGLASIIIGEALFGKRSVFLNILSVVLGSIIYRLVLTFVLLLGMPANYFKLLTVVVVTLALTIPVFKTAVQRRQHHA